MYELPTRYLKIKFILKSGIFESTLNNSKIIDGSVDGLSIHVNFTRSTGMIQSNANIVIFGMNMNDIRQLTQLQYYAGSYLPKNQIEIYAGYELNEDGMPPLAFKGLIFNAGANLNNVNRPFIIYALDLWSTGIASLPNIEAKGIHQINDIIQEIIANYKTQAGIEYIYQPQNVQGTINNFSTQGSFINQLDAITTQTNYAYKIDDPFVIVYKKNTNPNTFEYIIDKDTGLLGYPKIEQLGISIRVRYNSNLRWGGKIILKTFANLTENDIQLNITEPDTLEVLKQSEWYINQISSTLQNRDKMWESILMLNTYNYASFT